MTAQIGDGLILKGETVMLRGCPALPWHDPRLKKISTDEAMKACAEGLIFSTAYWRIRTMRAVPKIASSSPRETGRLLIEKLASPKR